MIRISFESAVKASNLELGYVLAICAEFKCIVEQINKEQVQDIEALLSVCVTSIRSGVSAIITVPLRIDIYHGGVRVGSVAVTGTCPMGGEQKVIFYHNQDTLSGVDLFNLLTEKIPVEI